MGVGLPLNEASAKCLTARPRCQNVRFLAQLVLGLLAHVDAGKLAVDGAAVDASVSQYRHGPAPFG
jgi:hypothetical protein